MSAVPLASALLVSVNASSLFASLLGKFRMEEPVSDVTDPRSSRASRSSLATSSTSPTISHISFSALFPNRWNKLSRLFNFEGPGGRCQRPRLRKDGGMSPAISSDEDDCFVDSDDLSGFSSKSSSNRGKQGLQAQTTPLRPTPTRTRRRGPSRNASGMLLDIFCLKLCPDGLFSRKKIEDGFGF